jgi:hypothetical protein
MTLLLKPHNGYPCQILRLLLTKLPTVEHRVNSLYGVFGNATDVCELILFYPIILTVQPTTVCANVEHLHATLTRLTSSSTSINHDYHDTLKLFIKQPQLLLMNSKTLASKIDTLRIVLQPPKHLLPPAEVSKTSLTTVLIDELIYASICGNPQMLARSYGLLGRAGFLQKELIRRVEESREGFINKYRGSKRNDLDLVKSFDLQRTLEASIKYGDIVKMSKILYTKAYWEYLPGYMDWLRDVRGVESEEEHGEKLKRVSLRRVQKMGNDSLM